MNKEQLLKEIEAQNLKLAELNTKLYELENKEQADVEVIRKGKAEEIKKLEKVLGKKAQRHSQIQFVDYLHINQTN